MNYLVNRKRNVLVTILISIVCFFLLQRSGMLDDAGMAAIILNWLPLIIGLITIVAYLIVHIFTKKFSWVVIVLGNVFNLVITARAFIEN